MFPLILLLFVIIIKIARQATKYIYIRTFNIYKRCALSLLQSSPVSEHREHNRHHTLKATTYSECVLQRDQQHSSRVKPPPAYWPPAYLPSAYWLPGYSNAFNNTTNSIHLRDLQSTASFNECIDRQSTVNEYRNANNTIHVLTASYWPPAYWPPAYWPPHTDLLTASLLTARVQQTRTATRLTAFTNATSRVQRPPNVLATRVQRTSTQR